MPRIEERPQGADFLKSLGFPTVDVHETFSHFDFTTPGRRVLVIGPMGSGKSEYAARLWRDAEVARRKSGAVKVLTSTGSLDRRNIFYLRSDLDSARFPDYPADALAYRGGYVRCGDHMAHIHDSFDLERVIASHPEVGTYIIDEASFFDERIAYVVR
ncbi:MAG: thymidine kinase, partial [Sphaerochaetaceae bacterium]